MLAYSFDECTERKRAVKKMSKQLYIYKAKPNPFGKDKAGNTPKAE